MPGVDSSLLLKWLETAGMRMDLRNLLYSARVNFIENECNYGEIWVVGTCGILSHIVHMGRSKVFEVPGAGTYCV